MDSPSPAAPVSSTFSTNPEKVTQLDITIFSGMRKTAALLATSVLLSACGSGSDSSDTAFSGFSAGSQAAVVATAAATGDGGSLALLDIAAPYSGGTNLTASASDIVVRANGDQYFVLGRFMTDNITAYSLTDPGTALYQFSVNDESAEPGVSANPYDLVFASDEKAYLIRYGSPFIWIVNPSATTEANFKIGEIDLSAYDAEGPPEAAGAAIVDGKLFVIMQRLGGEFGFTPVQNAYVAVFDTSTDLEIDTGTGGVLPGIELPAQNVIDLSVDPATDNLFIAAVGVYAAFDGSAPAELTGGVVTVDTSDYSADLLVDDDTVGVQVSAVAVASASAAYLVSYTGFGDNALVRFDPTTGALGSMSVAGLANADIADIQRAPDGTLWVAVNDTENPRIVIVDPADDSVISDSVNPGLSPRSIAFTNE
jgi:hypothetical protein